MKQQKLSQSTEHSPIAHPFGPGFSVSVADAVGRGASVFGRSFAAMQQESLRFMNQRLEDNMKVATEAGTCKSLPDLLALQQKWVATMTRAYADEWHRCNVLMTDIVRGNGVAPLNGAEGRTSRED
jgi:hypothetical protein